MANKKNLSQDVDLVAFISLLSVLICSLLLTAIWVQVGSMNIKQAVGGQPQSETKKQPTLWAHVHADGSLRLQLRDAGRVPRKLRNIRISALAENKIDKAGLETYLSAITEIVPQLKTALIQPKSETVYEKIITLMDQFKTKGFVDLGVAPL